MPPLRVLYWEPYTVAKRSRSSGLRSFSVAARRLGSAASVVLDRSAFGLSMLLNSRGVWLQVPVFKQEEPYWRPTNMPQFARYIGIDYSGAVTPESSCKGIRVYVAEGIGTPEQIQPPSSPRLYWTRRGLAEWLCEELAADTPTIVGIDHGFSFPIEYFDRYGLPRDWPNFLLA